MILIKKWLPKKPATQEAQNLFCEQTEMFMVLQDREKHLRLHFEIDWDFRMELNYLEDKQVEESENLHSHNLCRITFVVVAKKNNNKKTPEEEKIISRSTFKLSKKPKQFLIASFFSYLHLIPSILGESERRINILINSRKSD